MMTQIPPPITPIPMNDRFCTFRKTDGTRCGAYRLKDSPYCYQHEPSKAEERTASRSRGGKKSQSDAIPGWQDIPIDSPKDLQEAVQRVFNGVAKGDVHPRTANALASLGGLLLKLIESTDLEERLSRLEAEVLTNNRGKAGGFA